MYSILPARTKVVEEISSAVKVFETQTNIETHLSGLPLIRTVVGDRIQKEMKLFLFGSLALSVPDPVAFLSVCRAPH